MKKLDLYNRKARRLLIRRLRRAGSAALSLYRLAKKHTRHLALPRSLKRWQRKAGSRVRARLPRLPLLAPVRADRRMRILVAFTILASTIFMSSAAFAVWNGTFYEPGDTLNPECAPTDVDCDVLAPLTSLNGETLMINGSVSGTITIRSAAAAGTYTITLPTNDGDALQVLTTDGSGTLSWTTTASGTPAAITVTDTTDSTSYVALFESATGDLGPKTDAGLTYDSLTGVLTATGLAGPLAGNASTATALETARTIAGVSFDGTANIPIASTNLSDTASLARLSTGNSFAGANSFSSAGGMGTITSTATDAAGYALILNAPSGANHLGFQAGGAQKYVQYIDGNDLRFYDSITGADQLTLESGGNVGVGTINPAYTLDVSGTGNFSGAVTAAEFFGPLSGNADTVTGFSVTAGKILASANSLTLSGTDGSTLNIGNGGTLGSAAFTSASAYEAPITFSAGLTRSSNTVTANISTGIPGGQTIYGGTAANDDLTIEGTSNAAKTTSYINLQPNGGNVGIGETAPDANLFVKGSAAGTTVLTLKEPVGQTTQAFKIYNSSGSLKASWGTTNDTDYYLNAGHAVIATEYQSAGSNFKLNNNGVTLAATKGVLFTVGNVDQTVDTGLSRIGAATVAVGNGTNGDMSGILAAATIIGGTSTASDLNLKTTSGVGTTGADMHFLVGNNGATEAMTILNSGTVGIGETAPDARLTVKATASDGGANVFQVLNSSGAVKFAVAPGNTDAIAIGGTLSMGAQRLSWNGWQSILATGSTGGSIIFSTETGSTERMRLTSVGNLKIGGTATRGTTEGTRHIDIFDGTAPVGTLANGISLYSTSGELRVMDAAGNATLLSPHEDENNYWVFSSENKVLGTSLVIDMELMMKKINEEFGWDFVHDTENDEEPAGEEKAQVSLQDLRLNLDSIALPLEKANESFASRFFGKLAEWLGDAANGVVEVFAGTFRATDKLCINGTCITEAQLIKLLENSGTPHSSGGGSSLPDQPAGGSDGETPGSMDREPAAEREEAPAGESASTEQETEPDEILAGKSGSPEQAAASEQEVASEVPEE